MQSEEGNKSRNTSGTSIDSGVFTHFDCVEPHRRSMHGYTSNFVNSEPPTPNTEKHSDLTKFRYPRSSSLKTRRTPPGTPNCKAVRFADAFGLDLATVKHIFNSDCPPTVPASAKKHLVCSDCEDASDMEDFSIGGAHHVASRLCSNKCLHPCFPQPGDNPNFMRRVLDQNVCLERVHLSNVDGARTLQGTIRVKNLCFHKSVTVRVTYNDWRTFTDIPAVYSHSPDGGLTDCFTCQVHLSLEQLEDERMQFAVLYRTEQGDEFWDNSFGKNYVFMTMDMIKNPSL